MGSQKELDPMGAAGRIDVLTAVHHDQSSQLLCASVDREFRAFRSQYRSKQQHQNAGRERRGRVPASHGKNQHSRAYDCHQGANHIPRSATTPQSIHLWDDQNDSENRPEHTTAQSSRTCTQRGNRVVHKGVILDRVLGRSSMRFPLCVKRPRAQQSKLCSALRTKQRSRRKSTARLSYNISASKRMTWPKRQPHPNCATLAIQKNKELAWACGRPSGLCAIETFSFSLADSSFPSSAPGCRILPRTGSSIV